jgi:hypothetical protein
MKILYFTTTYKNRFNGFVEKIHSTVNWQNFGMTMNIAFESFFFIMVIKRPSSTGEKAHPDI